MEPPRPPVLPLEHLDGTCALIDGVLEDTRQTLTQLRLALPLTLEGVPGILTGAAQLAERFVFLEDASTHLRRWGGLSLCPTQRRVLRRSQLEAERARPVVLAALVALHAQAVRFTRRHPGRSVALERALRDHAFDPQRSG